MAISLQKGQKIDLTKGNAGLTEVLVGLGWDINGFTGTDFDLDATAFLVGANGKCPTEKHFIFYKNKDAHGVKHTGDNLTGAGDGDDEQMIVNLTAIPQDVEKVIFAVSIHDAAERGQNFGQVSNAFIRVADNQTGAELIRYDLGEDYSIETAMVVGELYRNNSEWKFAATGAGFPGGLQALVDQYY